MKVDEQNHINILKYDLSQQYDKEKEKELKYWYIQIDYTDALENAYAKNDDLEILKKRIQRNKHRVVCCVLEVFFTVTHICPL